ncbi:hypothetical protein [Morganella morganii]|uniref:hypothetical protein n=1 Tax=Morganella morganii TaxID=582 RepID=UPI0034D74D7B
MSDITQITEYNRIKELISQASGILTLTQCGMTSEGTWMHDVSASVDGCNTLLGDAFELFEVVENTLESPDCKAKTHNQKMSHYQTQGDLLELATVTGDLLKLMKEITCNGSPELNRFIPTLTILASDHCDKLMRDIDLRGLEMDPGVKHDQ